MESGGISNLIGEFKHIWHLVREKIKKTKKNVKCQQISQCPFSQNSMRRAMLERPQLVYLREERSYSEI